LLWTTPADDPASKPVVIYARVSSKEQEKEAFSISRATRLRPTCIPLAVSSAWMRGTP
jgi:hypothetical protein